MGSLAAPVGKFNRAFCARASLRRSGTDALRIFDGAGDGIPGIEIDDFAGRWMVQTRDGEFPGWLAFQTQPDHIERGESRLPVARSVYWKRLGERGSPPEWIAGERVDEPFIIEENGMRFQIDFQAGYSQGLFLDQRENRRRVRETAGGKRVLNCFAYTCAFGVCAALGGGVTVNLDLSKPSLDWGRRNYELNGIDPAGHDFIYGDVFDWIKRLGKKGRTFHIIILDPPTFSRDKRGRVFRVERDFAALIAEVAAMLEPGGAIFASTNRRSLTPGAFRQLVSAGIDPRQWSLAGGAMPPDFTGEKYLKSLWLTRQGASSTRHGPPAHGA